MRFGSSLPIVLQCLVHVAIAETTANTVPLSSTHVDIRFAQHCADPIECFASLVQCDANGDRAEVLNLQVKAVPGASITPSTVDTAEVSELFSLAHLSSGTLRLRLQMDKSVPHCKVARTHRSGRRPMTETITDSVFYHNRTDIPHHQQKQQHQWEQTFPKQFKTINEFYGNVHLDSLTATNSTKVVAHIRTVIHFVRCGHLRVYGFVRYRDTLYQIRPVLTDVPTNTEHNIHQVILVTRGIDSELFTNKDISNETKNTVQDKGSSGNRYCLTRVIADQSFYHKMNSDFAQVVIYVMLEFVLFNEILTSTQWKDPIRKKYRVALPSIGIDMTIASELGSDFDEAQIVDTLANITEQENYCLTYLFTGRRIIDSRDNKSSSSGFSFHRAAFNLSSNTKIIGSTSIGHCGQDPWAMHCLLGFKQQFARSMGASEVLPLLADSANITYDDLKFSSKSIEEMSDHLFDDNEDSFVNAKEWSKCGNSILEDGEQCDEGPYGLCCNSKCRLKSAAECSPFNSLCCGLDCLFHHTVRNASGVTIPNRACVPWNYCNDKRWFCSHRQSYCQLTQHSSDDPIEATVNCTIEEPFEGSSNHTEIKSRNNARESDYSKQNDSSSIFIPIVSVTLIAILIGAAIGAFFMYRINGKKKIEGEYGQIPMEDKSKDDSNTGKLDVDSSEVSKTHLESMSFESFRELLKKTLKQLDETNCTNRNKEFGVLFKNLKEQLEKAKPKKYVYSPDEENLKLLNDKNL